MHLLGFVRIYTFLTLFWLSAHARSQLSNHGRDLVKISALVTSSINRFAASAMFEIIALKTTGKYKVSSDYLASQL